MPRQVTLQELKNKIGEKNAQKLYKEFAGMIIYIPKKGIKFSTQEAKEKCIRNLYYNSGYSITQIAEKVDLSEDRIRKIIYKNIHN